MNCKCRNCGEIYDLDLGLGDMFCSLRCSFQYTCYVSNDDVPYSIESFKLWIRKKYRHDPNEKQYRLWCITKGYNAEFTTAELTDPNYKIREMTKQMRDR